MLTSAAVQMESGIRYGSGLLVRPTNQLGHSALQANPALCDQPTNSARHANLAMLSHLPTTPAPPTAASSAPKPAPTRPLWRRTSLQDTCGELAAGRLVECGSRSLSTRRAGPILPARRTLASRRHGVRRRRRGGGSGGFPRSVERSFENGRQVHQLAHHTENVGCHCERHRFHLHLLDTDTDTYIYRDLVPLVIENCTN